MIEYKNPVNFYIPENFKFPILYQTLIKIYRENPEKFVNNATIGAFYGSPGGIWNSGRYERNQLSPVELIAFKNFHETYMIPFRFTFTNCLIEEKHLHDTYCNKILEIFDTGHNEILCNSSMLESYIKDIYKNNYKYISSTTKRLSNEIEQLQEFDKDYYMVVLDYDHNKNFDFLNKIKNKNKCEILINPVCSKNCSRRLEHYKLISRMQLFEEIDDRFNDCKNQAYTLFDCKKNSQFIDNKEIDEYSDLGFLNFKIEGRSAYIFDLIETILYYLIKDEYQLEVRDILQKTVY